MFRFLSLQVPHLLSLLGFVGIVCDFLTTGYYLFVARGSALPAAATSLFITLTNFWVLSRVLPLLDTSWENGIAYGLGNAIGCFLIITLNNKRMKFKEIG